MRENVVTFPQLCARLERAIHCPVGMEGLDILMFGWIAKKHIICKATLAMRRKRDGVEWLTLGEAVMFSRYAGYDLTKD